MNNIRNFWQGLLTAVLFILALSPRASAAELIGRSENPFGIYGQYLSDSFYMGGIGLNVTNWMRFNAGYGQKKFEVVAGAEAEVSVIEGGVRFFIPKWKFSPFVGAAYTSGSATVRYRNVNYSASADGVSPTFGFDYQNESFNAGIVVYVSTISGFGPYVGYYF